MRKPLAFHEEEKERRELRLRESRARAENPPVPARRMTQEELDWLSPTFSPNRVTEVEHKAELAAEFGDPEHHEGDIVPHPPQLIDGSGMLSVSKHLGQPEKGNPAIDAPPDLTYSLDKVAAEVDMLAVREAAEILNAKDVPEKDRAFVLVSKEDETVEECFDRHLVAPPLDDEPYPDMVNTPAHYLFGDGAKVECIDAIKSALSEDEFRGYCKGNAMKYIWRSNHKGRRTQDLRKCAWYSTFASGIDPREKP